MSVIAKDVAEDMVKNWEADLESELSQSSRGIIVRAVSNGRVDLADGVFTVRLVSPIALKNGDTVETLKIREPNARDLQKAAKGNRDDMDTTIDLISALSGQSVAVIDQIAQRDATLISQLLTFFQ